MYVIVVNNIVRLGPLAWRSSYFQNFINDILNISSQPLPLQPPGEAIVITDTVKILPVRDTIIPEYNARSQYIHLITESISNDSVDILHHVDYKQIEVIKQELIAEIKNERYAREVCGFTTIIQDRSIHVDTTREGRLSYFNGASGHWKFAYFDQPVWISITDSDLNELVSKVKTYIQECFSWEIQEILKINQMSSISELENYIVPTHNRQDLLNSIR